MTHSKPLLLYDSDLAILTQLLSGVYFILVKMPDHCFRDSHKSKRTLKREGDILMGKECPSYKLGFRMGAPVGLASDITHDNQVYFIFGEVK